MIPHFAKKSLVHSYVMATQSGRQTEFQPESNSNKADLERVHIYYFTANDIPAERRVSNLLSSIGVTMYALLRDLVALHQWGTKSFKEISDVLCAHSEPK